MDNQQQALPAPNFKIGLILGDAWDKLKGSKFAIWLVILATILAVIIVDSIVIMVTGQSWKNQPFWLAHIVMPIVNALFLGPFIAGPIMIGARRARDERVEKLAGFKYFNHFIPLAIALIITSIISNLGFIIVNLPAVSSHVGHYKYILEFVAAIYSLVISALFLATLPLIADKSTAPLEAITQSINLTKPHLFKIVLLYIICYVFLVIAFIPMIVGILLQHAIVTVICMIVTVIICVWLLPYFFMIIGNIYHRLVD